MDLLAIKKGISIVYQPIHNLESGAITGFEALARGPDGPMQSPSNFLRFAASKSVLDEMEMFCFKKAVEESVKLQCANTLGIFINFSPNTITKHYREIIRRLRCVRGKAVIELIEYAVPQKSRHDLIAILGELQSSGLMIALDDVGNGDRNFGDICELPADIMKIDRRIIQGLTKYKNGSAPRYQIILKALVGITRKLDRLVIAEGIETENQHDSVKDAGIHLAQGFYLSRPQSSMYWEKELNIGSAKIASGRYLQHNVKHPPGASGMGI